MKSLHDLRHGADTLSTVNNMSQADPNKGIYFKVEIKAYAMENQIKFNGVYTLVLIKAY